MRRLHNRIGDLSVRAQRSSNLPQLHGAESAHCSGSCQPPWAKPAQSGLLYTQWALVTHSTWRQMALKATSCLHSLGRPDTGPSAEQLRLLPHAQGCSWQCIFRQEACKAGPQQIPPSPTVNGAHALLPELQSALADTETTQAAAFRWLQRTFEQEGHLQPLPGPRWQTLRNRGRKLDLGRCQNQAPWGCALSGWLWPGQPAAAKHQDFCPSPASWRSTCCPQRQQLRLSAGRRVGITELAAETLDETGTTALHLLSTAPAAAAICRRAGAS